MRSTLLGPRPSLFASLRWNLSAAISGVVLLCTAACIVGAMLFLRPALADRARSELLRTLSGVSGYMTLQRGDLLGAAGLVAADPALAAEVASGNRQALIVRLAPYYAGLNADIVDVIDARGRVLVRMEDTTDRWAYGDAVENRASVRAALAGHKVTAFEADLPHREAAGGYALRATVPVRSGMRIVGAVVVGRQLDSIFAERIANALNTSVNLIAGGQLTGTTLTDRNGLPMAEVPVPGAMLARVATGQTSVVQRDEGGQPVLSGLIPLTDAAGRPVGAVEVVSSLEPLYTMAMQLSFLLLAMGGAVIVVGTVLALAIGRRLTARLQALESVAAQVAAHAEDYTGALDSGATPPDALEALLGMRGDDEVASLARSFGAMVHALDERLVTNAQLYTAAQARVRELSGLAEIARLLTAGLSLEETLDALGNHVCRLTGSSAVGILLAREGAGPAQLGGCGLPPGYREATDAVLSLPEDAWQGIATLDALRSGVTAWNRIAETPARRADLRQLAESGGWGAVTAVPLRLQGRTVGVMSCYTVSDQPLPEPELRLLTTIADQVAVAVENARLEDRARSHAAQEERARLARELHDSVSQAVYGIALGVRTALTLLERDPARAAATLEHVLPLAEAALTEMRALIFDLRPDALEAEGLVMALEKQAAALRARHGLAVHLHAGAEPPVSPAAKEALYRIAREALHNTVKHARAGVVDLNLHSDGDGLVLEIRDDGLGFDPHLVPPEHLGLHSMQERVEQVGGRLEVWSATGQGTRIRVQVPGSPARQNGDALHTQSEAPPKG